MIKALLVFAVVLFLVALLVTLCIRRHARALDCRDCIGEAWMRGEGEKIYGRCQSCQRMN